MAFGDFVRSHRLRSAIGLNEFAHKLGVSPAYWSRLERGLENPPRDELVEKVALELGLPLDELFIQAERFPPDMQRNLRHAVTAYRRFNKGK